MPDTFEAISQQLMENETAIGRLYELFGRTFQQDAELWVGLARDEFRHAVWIRQALETATPEQRQKKLLSIRLAAVETMLQYVASIAGRCRQGELTRVTAQHRKRLIDALERVRQAG
jgi:hypothetical protein